MSKRVAASIRERLAAVDARAERLTSKQLADALLRFDAKRAHGKAIQTVPALAAEISILCGAFGDDERDGRKYKPRFEQTDTSFQGHRKQVQALFRNAMRGSSV